MNIMNYTKVVIKNMFQKPVTRQYPENKREYTSRTRGQISIDIDTCIFCGICSKKCPTGAIEVKREEKSWSIERFGCIQCGYCAESCPKNCLSMLQDYPQPDAKKPRDIYTKKDI